MFTINENYLKLPGSYLFSDIAKKIAAYQQENPDKEIHPPGDRGCDTAPGAGDHRGSPWSCGRNGSRRDLPRICSG